MSTEASHVAVRPLSVAADSAPPMHSGAMIEAEGVPFPLNSRRLTGLHLKTIAKALGLPTTGTSDETRVMIDGKLEEMGRDSRNVQVILKRDDRGKETLSLKDVDGVLVNVATPEERDEVGTGRYEGSGGEESGSTSS